MQKPEWLKTLSEKATHGKAKYVTILVPFIGDYVTFDYVRSKSLRTALALGDGCGRVACLAASLITGNRLFLEPYAGMTIGEEVGTNVPKIDEYFTERNRRKRVERDLRDMIKNKQNIQWKRIE